MPTADDPIVEVFREYMRKPQRNGLIADFRILATGNNLQDARRQAGGLGALLASVDTAVGDGREEAIIELVDAEAARRDPVAAAALRAAVAVRLIALHRLWGVARRVLEPVDPDRAGEPEACFATMLSIRAGRLYASDVPDILYRLSLKGGRIGVLAGRQFIAYCFEMQPTSASADACERVLAAAADHGDGFDSLGVYGYLKLCTSLERYELPAAIADVIRDRPDFFAKLLPIAPLLRANLSLLPADRHAQVMEGASLYDAAEASQRRLAEALGDRAHSVAVVGNSPCELTKGLGPAIDRHDLVVRFNDFSVAPPFDRDYGRKVDVWTTNLRGSADTNSVHSPFVLLSSRRYLFHDKFRRLAPALKEGRGIGYIPAEVHMALLRRLGSPPSAGLVTLSYLAALRGSLDDVGIYGFSFVDQIGDNPTSAHYFEESKPSAAHDWLAELTEFRRLMADGRQPRAALPDGRSTA
jgi:hypothetical protein